MIALPCGIATRTGETNQAVGSLDLHFERPSDGTYAEVRGSRIDDDDQYYQAVYGQAGAYKVQAFIRDMPNILSTDARPIWNGVGSNVLTLPRSLTPGESTSAQVAAVSAATPVQTLGVTRKKEGLEFQRLTSRRIGRDILTSLTNGAEGARPYGGPFGEDWPGANGGTGAILETVKPIDDATINFNTGAALRRVAVARGFRLFRLLLSGRVLELLLSTALLHSLHSRPPDNRTAAQPRVKCRCSPITTITICMALSPVTPMNGEVSFTVSEVLMTQRDTLIPPTNCQGYLGLREPPLPAARNWVRRTSDPRIPTLVPCSQWNTHRSALAVHPPT